jgi:hypothetical protein
MLAEDKGKFMFAHLTRAATGHSRSSIISAAIWIALALTLLAATMQLTPGNLAGLDFNSVGDSADANSPAVNASLLEPFLLQENAPIDSSSLNDHSLLPEPSPAPLAVAAYD